MQFFRAAHLHLQHQPALHPAAALPNHTVPATRRSPPPSPLLYNNYNNQENDNNNINENNNNNNNNNDNNIVNTVNSNNNTITDIINNVIPQFASILTADILPRAGGFPPRVSSPEERRYVEQQVRTLLDTLNQHSNLFLGNYYHSLLAARLYVAAYNLDMPEAFTTQYRPAAFNDDDTDDDIDDGKDFGEENNDNNNNNNENRSSDDNDNILNSNDQISENSNVNLKNINGKTTQIQARIWFRRASQFAAPHPIAAAIDAEHGAFLFAAGLIPEATQALQSAADAGYHDALYSLALCHYTQQRYGDAVSCLVEYAEATGAINQSAAILSMFMTRSLHIAFHPLPPSSSLQHRDHHHQYHRQ